VLPLHKISRAAAAGAREHETHLNFLSHKNKVSTSAKILSAPSLPAYQRRGSLGFTT
jgi:hypothetical protein